MKRPGCKVCGVSHYSHESHVFGTLPKEPAPKRPVTNVTNVTNTVTNKTHLAGPLSDASAVSRVLRWREKNRDRYNVYQRDLMRRRRA